MGTMPLMRRLFSIISTISLIFCIAIALLWFRSYRLGDFGEFIGSLESRSTDQFVVIRNVGIYSSHGRFAVGLTQSEFAPSEPSMARYPDGHRLVWGSQYCWERFPFTPIVASAASRSPWPIDIRDRVWRYSGFSTTITTSRGLAVPHWLPLCLFALLPAIAFHHHSRRYLRRRSHHCPNCGYDLRATPEHCPECGQVAGQI